MKKVIMSLLITLIALHVDAQKGEFVNVDHGKIFFKVHGEGEPLLLLHGYGASHKIWDNWIEDLSRKYMLVIPDMRGHGQSTNTSDSFTFEQSAKDMFSVLNRLQIDKFHAMGQSGGALTLLHMATIDTTRISSMILVAGTNEFSTPVRKEFKNISYEDWKDWTEPYQPRGDKQIKKIVEHLNGWADNYKDMNFNSAYLSTIACPTLIIHGDRDHFYDVDIPALLYKSIPNSYLWIMPNEGHIPGGIYSRNSIWSEVLHKVIEHFLAGDWSEN